MRKVWGRMMRQRRAALCLATACVLAAVVGCLGCRRQTAPAGGVCPPPGTPAVFTVPDISTSPIPVWRPVAGRTVIFDPGHGGKDNGASHHGLKEKELNLEVALMTAQLLRSRGVVVFLTRDDDVFMPLPERSVFANGSPNAVFVSIHANAAEKSPNASGIETFILTAKQKDEDRALHASETFRIYGSDSMYARQVVAELTVKSRERGQELARLLQRALVARLGEPDRGVKQANLAVLRETYLCPAALVEVGFVSNARTAERMKTAEWRRRTAEALCEGITEFLRQPE